MGKEAKKLEKDPPVIVTKDGRRVPIKRVRCFKVQGEIQAIADRDHAPPRYVIAGGNHHMEVWREVDASTGKTRKWGHCTVSRLEAAERYRQGARIVERDHGPGRQFCFSLSEGDLVMARRSPGESEAIWYVRTVRARGSLVVSRATDARKKEEIQNSKELWDVQLNTLMSLGARKVVVTPLGEIVEAHD